MPADEENTPEAETAPLYDVERKAVPGGAMHRKKGVADEARPGGEVEVTLAVKDPVAAAGAIEKAVTRLGGTITGRAYSEGDILYTRIDGQKFTELIDRLSRIGTMQERPQLTEGAAGTVDLVIRW